MIVDLNKYAEFVGYVTSKESNDLTSFMNRLDRLDANYEKFNENEDAKHGPDVNVSLLITAAMGMGSESGEFQEIVKKLLFQGKQLSEDVHFHLVRELGDVIWYWINACRALGVDPNQVINTNIEKLKSRYPGGSFDVFYSENRKEGDV